MIAVTNEDLKTWAPVASAGFACLAATASWQSIRAGRRQWLAAQRPLLVPQLVDDQDGVHLDIRNAGPGGAQGVQFCVVVGDLYASGYAGPNFGGYLATDETAIINTQFPPEGPVRCVVTCRDAAERVHISTDARSWTLGGRRPRWFRRDGPTDPEAAFELAFGEAPAEGRTRARAAGKAKLVAGTTFPANRGS